MKLVLDANMLIAALISRGICAELLEHCVLNHTIVAPEFLLDELRGNPVGEFKYTDQDAADAIALLKSQMEIVAPESLEQPVCRDPDDDQVLGTAIAGQAQCMARSNKSATPGFQKPGFFKKPGFSSTLQFFWDDPYCDR